MNTNRRCLRATMLIVLFIYCAIQVSGEASQKRPQLLRAFFSNWNRLPNSARSAETGRGLLKHFMKFRDFFQQPNNNVIIITSPQDPTTTTTTTTDVIPSGNTRKDNSVTVRKNHTDVETLEEDFNPRYKYNGINDKKLNHGKRRRGNHRRNRVKKRNSHKIKKQKRENIYVKYD